jgi:hypothetical protein
MPLVQRWLGHASLRTTSIYIDVTGAEECVIVALMANLGAMAPNVRFPKTLARPARAALADADALIAKYWS